MASSHVKRILLFVEKMKLESIIGKKYMIILSENIQNLKIQISTKLTLPLFAEKSAACII